MNKETMIKRSNIIKRLKLTIDEIYELPENACVRINSTYYSNLIVRASKQKIRDPRFWQIIKKIEEISKMEFKLGKRRAIVRNYYWISVEELKYLLSIVNYKTELITAFLKSKYTKEDLEEYNNSIYQKYEEKLVQEQSLEEHDDKQNMSSSLFQDSNEQHYEEMIKGMTKRKILSPNKTNE